MYLKLYKKKLNIEKNYIFSFEMNRTHVRLITQYKINQWLKYLVCGSF